MQHVLRFASAAMGPRLGGFGNAGRPVGRDGALLTNIEPNDGAPSGALAS